MSSLEKRSEGRVSLLLLLFFLSGVAALIYEVLWLKELGILFGVTAYAAATTLAVFFLGLSFGSLVWGRRTEHDPNPLRTYGYLEIGIAVSALLYFLLSTLYLRLYPSLFATFADHAAIFLAVKVVMAAGVLGLPAFFMGGTLPVMGQYLTRRSDELGRVVTALYAINTFGAALGALAAGFYLPLVVGFRRSYLIAIGLNLLIAAVAIWWSRTEPAEPAVRPASSTVEDTPSETSKEGVSIRPALLWMLAFASGFLALALEVLWTRMFAQVLQNSVYTFAVILTVFLTSLALGSAVANLLCRTKLAPTEVLPGLLIVAGLLVATTPWIFYRFTSGLEFVAAGKGWSGYVMAVFASTSAVLLVPGVAIGTVFPYLMKLAENQKTRDPKTSVGHTIGRLASINTFAAIVGSLAAGFVMLDAFGLWSSLRLIGALYLFLALMLSFKLEGRRRWLISSLALIGLVVVGWVLNYERFGLVSLDSSANEELVDLREGAHGTVAVIRRGEDLRLKVNNSYLLGTSLSTPNLRLQSWIPLVLHPEPRSVFFLGMGTGITAGGALDFPVESIVVTELNPDVVAASRRFFGPFANGLFEDPRVEILEVDGRNHLTGSPQAYDVIIADIFLTYRAGTGSLFTREHFETVRSRLAPGGLFAQWLPMFELSRAEFGIISRTMLEVFPQVTLWRRGFSPRFPIFALVGQMEVGPLDFKMLDRNLENLRARTSISDDLWLWNIPMAAYAGNLTASRSLFDSSAIATDDRPSIEYLSARTNRENWGAGKATALAWANLGVLCQEVLEGCLPANDPYLVGSPESARNQVAAGLELYHGETLRRLGRESEARPHFERYRKLVESQLESSNSNP